MGYINKVGDDMFNTEKNTAFTRDIANNAIKVLLVDDNAFDRQRIHRLSEKSGLVLDIQDAPTINDMSERLDRMSFDLIMIDYNLASGDGLQALGLVKNHTANKSAATIMVTGQEQTSIAVSAFRHGCHDYVQKADLSPELVRTTVLNVLQKSGFSHMPLSAETADIRHLIQSAMQDGVMRDMMKTALDDGLQQLIQSADVSVAPPVHSDMFLDEFLQEDEFVFRH